MVNSLDDSKIIELFYEHSEQAIIELSNKYGTVCTRVTKGVAVSAGSAQPIWVGKEQPI